MKWGRHKPKAKRKSIDKVDAGRIQHEIDSNPNQYSDFAGHSVRIAMTKDIFHVYFKPEGGYEVLAKTKNSAQFNIHNGGRKK